MERTVFRLTVFFEEPFWVGVCEREQCGRYEVCKVTFGSEPKEYEVYAYFLENYDKLRFSPSVEKRTSAGNRLNPKRMQREIHRSLQKTGVGTKAQQALKLQQEQGKLERKMRSRKEREECREQQFKLSQERRKEKHRGH